LTLKIRQNQRSSQKLLSFHSLVFIGLFLKKNKKSSAKEFSRAALMKNQRQKDQRQSREKSSPLYLIIIFFLLP
jgi:hypothetical protein